MRERIQINDLKFIIVCLLPDKNVITQKALSDAVLIRDMGARVEIWGRGESYLSVECEANHISFISFTSVNTLRLFIQLYNHMRFFLKNNPPDIVHIYDYYSTLPLGAALKNATNVAMIYTNNQFLNQLYRPFWHDFCLTRIDLVILFSHLQEDYLRQDLPLGKTRYKVLGAGLNIIGMSEQTLSSEKSPLRFCTYVSNLTDNIQIVHFIFRLVAILKEEPQLTKNFKLTLFTDKRWIEHPEMNQLKRMILEWGVEMYVQLSDIPWNKRKTHEHDLYISLNTSYPFEPRVPESLISGIPVIVPRIGQYLELTEGGTFGLTYAPGDLRDLKKSVLQIYNNLNGFKERIKEAKETLIDKHHSDSYAMDLCDVYIRVYSQKLRFSLIKK